MGEESENLKKLITFKCREFSGATITNIADQISTQKRTDVPDKTFTKGKNPDFEVYWFTHQKVSNEAYEEDHR